MDPDIDNFFYGSGYRYFFSMDPDLEKFSMDPNLNKNSNILKVLNKLTKNYTTCNNTTKLEIYTVAI